MPPTIDRIRFLLNSSFSQEGGDALLGRASALFHSTLREELDCVLSQAPSVRIERLTLSLGTLNASDWELELPLRLRKQLEEQLRNWQRQHFYTDNADQTALMKPAKTETQKTSQDKLIVVDTPIAPDESVLAFERRLPSLPAAQQTHPALWARASLRPAWLALWLQRLSLATLQQRAAVLVNEANARFRAPASAPISTPISTPVSALPLPFAKIAPSLLEFIKTATREQMEELLPVCALFYLQRHLQILVPNAVKLPRGIGLSVLQSVLPHLLATYPLYPLREEIQRWLEYNCADGKARSYWVESLRTVIGEQTVSARQATANENAHTRDMLEGSQQNQDIHEAALLPVNEAEAQNRHVDSSCLEEESAQMPEQKQQSGQDQNRNQEQVSEQIQENRRVLRALERKNHSDKEQENTHVLEPDFSLAEYRQSLIASRVKPPFEEPLRHNKIKQDKPNNFSVYSREQPDEGSVFRDDAIVQRPQEISPRGLIWPVYDAGILLLWPLLPSLLKKWGLLQDNRLINPMGAMRCLQALVWGEEPLLSGQGWPDSMLLRLLCSIDIHVPLPETIVGCPEDVDVWLKDLEAWLVAPPVLPLTKWREFELSEIRKRFIQRSGVLTLRNAQWFVQIERIKGDEMLEQLPWPVVTVSYPWLTWPLQICFVESMSR